MGKEASKPSEVKAIGGYPVHELCAIFPPMDAEQFAELKESIRLTGQGVEVLLHEGKIIDGQNRAEACVQLKLPIKTRTWDGKGDLLDFLWSLNGARRHMTPDQLAIQAGLFQRYRSRQERVIRSAKANAAKSGARVLRGAGKVDTRREASQRYGISMKRVRKAIEVLRADESMAARVLSKNHMTLSQAYKQVLHKKKKAELEKLAANVTVGRDVFELHTGDCLDVMKPMRGGRFRLIVTDPPYNQGVDYGNGKSADDLPVDEYLDWCQAWMEQCARLLTNDGSMFVVISERYQADFAIRLRRVGLHHRRTIIWNEGFAMYTDRNFAPCARFIHYVTKDPARFVFNTGELLEPSLKQTKYNDKRANSTGRVPGNVWEDIPRLTTNEKERLIEFPTQLPVALVKRIITAASEPGDYVFDPFNGSGTAGVASVALGRRYVGIDDKPANVKLATTRIKASIASAA